MFRPEAYSVTVTPLCDADGGGFLATICDLPGCMGDGETEMEAIADVRSAAFAWAEGALADGEELPLPTNPVQEAAE
ncbi:type II toxin-antitoxin system HicB family antitoxin [Jiella endophytica]|uniref:Type II toxin-antitoxin system HicB family antitoxin n=1 Tax=Jiella endophytica TaxID=2558362 RepID=A0A4Y8RFI7_9HYPH|nr:type II toxin-antitoxin system HicB family antitoxin [Jiella endophytica]